MNWTDAKTGDVTKGFREMGFLPEAFVNMLAVLGWNDGTEQELFNMEELVAKFSVERISKAGAKFDFEKAKWFNHEWIKKANDAELLPKVTEILHKHEVSVIDGGYLATILGLVKERMTFVEDFWEQASFFFKAPMIYDID